MKRGKQARRWQHKKVKMTETGADHSASRLTAAYCIPPQVLEVSSHDWGRTMILGKEPGLLVAVQ